MNVGYASSAIGIVNSTYKTIKKDKITPQRLVEVIQHNLHVLANLIDYNITNNIKLFRISSDLIPFGASPLNTVTWESLFKEEF